MSHRALLLGALGDGVTHARNWLAAGDTQATLAAVRSLGVGIERGGDCVSVHGSGWHPPGSALDLVNAGTGIRLLAGILAGQNFPSVLDGSPQLRRRPMARVIAPLREMGALIEAKDGYPPLRISPAPLHGIEYYLPVASAQVKSAVLLAALFASGPTAVIEPGPTRDHTERMLMAMGADIRVAGARIEITPGRRLRPLDFTVPGDFSSAAFLLAASCLVPGSDVTATGVNLNSRRTGFLEALCEMGAEIAVSGDIEEAGEPAGNLRARHSELTGITVTGEAVVKMIDEFPIFMVTALTAHGTTEVRDAAELRVKESDRLATMTAELLKMGAEIAELPDGFRIRGPQRLTGAVVDCHGDHRLAMSLAVAGLMASGTTVVRDAGCAGDSFPGFAGALRHIGASLQEVDELRVDGI